MRVVYLEIFPAVPLRLRPELHADGGRQLSGTTWSVRWKGSGDWMRRLRDEGLCVTERQSPPVVPRAPLVAFAVGSWVEARDDERIAEERRRRR